ncbi:24478_t:CDS:2, partial [Cetraspora pellucida]
PRLHTFSMFKEEEQKTCAILPSSNLHLTDGLAQLTFPLFGQVGHYDDRFARMLVYGFICDNVYTDTIAGGGWCM